MKEAENKASANTNKKLSHMLSCKRIINVFDNSEVQGIDVDLSMWNYWVLKGMRKKISLPHGRWALTF
jgi:hypothetical protein